VEIIFFKLKFDDDLIFGDMFFGGETPLMKRVGLNKSSFAKRKKIQYLQSL
jgi:hypothetical protein